jgi:ribosomal peptide maturation radical SAM protein 1
MSGAKAKLCLVSMPFSPAIMPSLGVSTLKATLAARGMPADIYYGAFEFFNTYYPADADPKVALFDYNFIASTTDLGNTFFADSLWGGGEKAPAAFDAFTRVPHPLFDREQVDDMIARFKSYIARTPELFERCLAARDWSRYDIVGFSSTFSQNVASLTFARMLRERYPSLMIVFGGANCEGEMGEQLMRSFPQVDAIVRGEADFSFPEFVECWRAGRDLSGVPGLVYRIGGEIRIGAPPQPITDMDRIPIPEFEDYLEQKPELLKHRSVQGQFSLPIETSRGCWWGQVRHCVFCGLNPTMMAFRPKSPARAIAEFRHLKEHYQADNIYAVDNIISRKYFKEVLPQIRDLGLRIFYETKSNLTEGEVGDFARAGITEIQPGIESLSTETLELMKKGVKAYQNIELLKWCSMHGVGVAWFILYGFPGERVEPYLQSIEIIPRLTHLPAPKNPNAVTLDRYSPLFMKRDEYGLKSVWPANRANIYYRGLSEEERFRIVYHFEMKLPQADTISQYRPQLWAACLDWSYQNLRGARFYQFESGRMTLLIDTRRQPKAYLLSGAGHHIHRALRRARRVGWLMKNVDFEQSFADLLGLAADDLYLEHVAAQIGAEVIEPPDGPEDLARFLADLDERWITVGVDDRVLALAIDCTRDKDAAPYGLTDFVRRPSATDVPVRSVELPARVQELGAAGE